ncbi:MAG: ABC transporter permease [Anaerolineales bacterium]|nr:ABC transporter permease [Anaerolineales bacterium]
MFFVPTMLAVYTIVFLMIHATPGSPWDAMSDKPLPAHVIEQLNEAYHLNDPLWVQYTAYLQDIFHGKLGLSYAQRRDVMEIMRDFLPVSLKLSVNAMVLAIALSVPSGVISALKQNTLVDHLIGFVSIFNVTVPSFVRAVLLILFFGVYLKMLPVGGWEGMFSTSAIIPTVALAAGPWASLTRFVRCGMLEVLNMDYIRTAKSKGLKESMVIMNHALKNALIPTATVAGLTFASLIAGSFYIETICIVPGIGRYFVKSVAGRDYPVIMGTTLLWALMVWISNLVVDVLYCYLDPRIRYD